MSLLGWLFGRGRNPLEPPARSSTPARRVETTSHVRTPERTQPATHGSTDTSDDALEHQARSMGVDVEALRRMMEERTAFVEEVAAAPRDWGFDLAPATAERRDAAAEYRRRTRMTGALGDSFLVAYDPLLAVVPRPPTMPDGTPLDVHLQRHARLDADAARDIAMHVRTTIQATLGKPLDADAFEHAVREAAWDHELDAAQVTPLVIRAVETLL